MIMYFIFRVSIKESSVAKLGSVCRRVYRIFSHAYFHHRTIFDEFEVTTNTECITYTYVANLLSNAGVTSYSFPYMTHEPDIIYFSMDFSLLSLS